MSRTLALSLLAVVVTFLMVAFGSDLFAERGVQVTHWGDGSVRTRSEALRYPDGRFLRDGVYHAFFADGSRQFEGAYRQGKAHGLWSEWDAQGVLRKRGPYRDGQPDGSWEYWNPGADPAYEQLNWRRGRVVEDGQPVSPAPDGPPRFFAWGGHIVGYLLMLLILLGPLPLALLAGSRGSTADAHAGAAEPWLVTLSAWCLLQTGVALGLATTGMLSAGPLFTIQAMLLGGGILYAWRRGCAPGLFLPRLDDNAAAVLLLASLGLGLAALEKGLAVPMTDWDGLAYHLPLMAEWIQNGSIVSLPELGQTGRYPSHWELMSTLTYFAFAEDLLFTLPNMIAWAILGLSVVVLGRRAGARPSDAAATALLLLSLPLLLLQTEEMKADLPTAAAFGAALVLGGLFSDTRRAMRPVLFLLGLGWLCGLKASGPAYALLALAAVLVWRFARARTADTGSHESRGIRLPRLLLVLIVSLVLAGYWYLRNYLELGNPLGDVQVKLLGQELFAGELQRADLQRTTFWSVWRPGELADLRALFAAAREWTGWILIPLVLSYLVALLKGWGSERARWITGFLLALVVICGALYMVTPFSGDNGSHGWRLTSWVGQTWRYALPKWLAATVLATLGWGALRLPRGVPVGLAVAAAAWATALHAAPPRASLVAAVIASGLIVTLLTWLSRGGSRVVKVSPTAMRRSGILIALVILAFSADVFWLHELREQRERGRLELYTQPYLHALQAPNHQPVGIAMTQLRYPFYGRDLMQTVIDLSCRGCSRSDWMRSVEATGVWVVALGHEPVRRNFAPPERDLRPWVEAEGAPFRSMHRVGSGAGEGIVIYEVLR